MKLPHSRIFYAFVAWTPALLIIAWLYTKTDLPGSVPLYSKLLLWTAASVATVVTAILAGGQVYEKTLRNQPSLIAAVGVGAIIWALTSNIVKGVLNNLGM